MLEVRAVHPLVEDALPDDGHGVGPPKVVTRTRQVRRSTWPGRTVAVRASSLWASTAVADDDRPLTKEVEGHD